MVYYYDKMKMAQLKFTTELELWLLIMIAFVHDGYTKQFLAIILPQGLFCG